MGEAIKAAASNINKSKPAQTTRLFLNILYRVVEILALAGVGGWLIYRETDMVTIGVGVALATWALVKLVGTTYVSEKSRVSVS